MSQPFADILENTLYDLLEAARSEINESNESVKSALTAVEEASARIKEAANISDEAKLPHSLNLLTLITIKTSKQKTTIIELTVEGLRMRKSPNNILANQPKIMMRTVGIRKNGVPSPPSTMSKKLSFSTYSIKHAPNVARVDTIKSQLNFFFGFVVSIG